MEAESFPAYQSAKPRLLHIDRLSGKPLCYPGCAWHANRTSLPVRCAKCDIQAFNRTLRIPDVLLEPPPLLTSATRKAAPSRVLGRLDSPRPCYLVLLEYKSKAIIHQIQYDVNKRLDRRGSCRTIPLATSCAMCYNAVTEEVGADAF